MFNKLFRVLKKSFLNLTNIDLIIREQININMFENLSVCNKSSLVCAESNAQRLIISLTTYSTRINDVHLVIESLGKQSIKANKIILWLDQNEFCLETLPKVLVDQTHRGLVISFCQNIKSYKKLIPTIQIFPDWNIITTDDDILYPYDFIEKLSHESNANPDTIICNHAHKITYKNKSLNKYKEWELETKDFESSKLIFPVGAGGIYYPTGCFDSRLINVDDFMLLAPTADDMWFKLMSSLNGFPSKRINDVRDFNDRFIPITRGQKIALYHNNVNGGMNDLQLDKLLTHYKLSVTFFLEK
ncbi:conserved protein of unknown function, might belong to glycosyltransferase [Shewanella benthica]|uniref:Glycosyltransferase n=1 Tax=Shewanella benthica TaxID=43661 RepID=A0A330M909_9GAMM|nr:glycosyl transferase [Shewanella benthica]SQH77490.1 conserved protein of unknown function, might belong to glycosyltransferase [Shewanella benthica]